MIPPNYTYQLSNARGDQEVRLLQCNYLPLAMLVMPIPEFFFNNEVVDYDILYSEDESRRSPRRCRSSGDDAAGERGIRAMWVGNFFPDMKTWDELEAHRQRGAGGSVIDFRSRTGRGGHMSVFPVGTYKIAHRHGPGTVIVIPDGEGFSVLWPPGQRGPESLRAMGRGERLRAAEPVVPPALQHGQRRPPATSPSRAPAQCSIPKRACTSGRSSTSTRTRRSGAASRPSWPRRV